VIEITVEEKRRRKDLKTKRDHLFEEYLKHPMDTRLALEIKLIDDQLADAVTPRISKNGSTFRGHPK